MVCGWAPNPFAWSWYIWFEEFYSCILEVRNELHANVMPIAIGCKNFGTWLGIATRVLSHIRALENSVWLCVHTYILLIKETTDHIVLDVCCRRGSILNGKRRPIGNLHLRLAIGSLIYHSHWSPQGLCPSLQLLFSHPVTIDIKQAYSDCKLSGILNWNFQWFSWLWTDNTI